MLMKLLTTPALLAGVAVAQPPNFTNDIPVDAFYTIGDDFVLTWSETGISGTFELSVAAWNSTPYGYTTGPFGSSIPEFDTRNIKLDTVAYADGAYTWTVEPANGDEVWQGEEFYYSFSASYPYGGESPRAFHITA
ncbi:hypothetical protein GGR57DRAFT_459584 [Xylariaceae sp. FL1272]|nr:hypothetical protein GGR57DRAFT_459584 [Xylariaceae sp. FL1272]